MDCAVSKNIQTPATKGTGTSWMREFCKKKRKYLKKIRSRKLEISIGMGRGDFEQIPFRGIA